MEDRVIVIVGPTGVGKTKLSVELAKQLNTEVISGDSVQIFKQLDIGSAKVTPEEMQGVKHHLIDVLELEETYSVAEFQTAVREKIAEIHAKGMIPILSGGTGLYVKAALYEYEFSDEARNTEYINTLKHFTNEELFALLDEVDPESTKLFHPNNRRRIERALEYYQTHGKPISAKQRKNKPLYNIIGFGLTRDREKLYERINLRVDLMVEAGLLEEVKNLLPFKKHIQAIGYNELFPYFEGEITLESALDEIKQNSRRYAKKQFTWFKNQMDLIWFDVEQKTEQEILDEMLDVIKNV